MSEEIKTAGAAEAPSVSRGVLTGYKPEQGRIVRQAAFWTLLFIAAYGAYRLRLTLDGWDSLSQPFEAMGGELPILGWTLNASLLIALGVFVGTWVGLAWFLNRPKSADMLIETEGELKKVTWPTFTEAMDSTIVVIFVVLVLLAFVMAADWVLGNAVDYLLFKRS